MNKILDVGLVALALAASVGYAFSALGPKGLRGRLWMAIARVAECAPAGLHLDGIARRLTEAAAGRSAGGCGGCDNCGAAEPTGDSTGKSASEIRVPLTKMVKRR